jgi:hypothetical protein
MFADNFPLRFRVCLAAVVLALVTLAPLAARAQDSDRPGGSYIDSGRFSGHKGPVQALAASRDGRYVATVGDDRLCYVIETKSWKQARRLGPHRAALRSVAFAASGGVVVGGVPETSGGSSVFLWDPRTARTVAQTGGGEQGVVSVAIAPDDQRLVAARGDGGVSIWFLKTNEIDQIEAPTAKRTCVAFTPTANRCSPPDPKDGSSVGRSATRKAPAARRAKFVRSPIRASRASCTRRTASCSRAVTATAPCDCGWAKAAAASPT